MNGGLKIIVGAGDTWQPGWISLNEEELDITDAAQWAELFEPDSIDVIFAEHVWEHLTWEEGMVAARLCYLYLKRGGVLRIAVPDGLHRDDRYRAWVMPGTGFNGDDHKVLYDYRSLTALMRGAGFRAVVRECFDERGALHSTVIDDGYGLVSRRAGSVWSGFLTAIVGCRNGGYTSLVVDGLK